MPNIKLDYLGEDPAPMTPEREATLKVMLKKYEFLASRNAGQAAYFYKHELRPFLIANGLLSIVAELDPPYEAAGEKGVADTGIAVSDAGAYKEYAVKPKGNMILPILLLGAGAYFMFQ
jgi:hypothetical protein